MTKEEFFNQNKNIAYKIANKYSINYGYMIEDIKQVALLGLWKAVLTFKNTHAFSTYAYRVIYNEINYYLRKEKYNKKVDSIDRIINDDEENKLTLLDTIEDDVNLIDKLTLNELIDIEYEVLEHINNNKQKEIYLLSKQGKSQIEISKLYNISQAQVCRILKKIKNLIKEKYEGGIEL